MKREYIKRNLSFNRKIEKFLDDLFTRRVVKAQVKLLSLKKGFRIEGDIPLSYCQDYNQVNRLCATWSDREYSNEELLNEKPQYFADHITENIEELYNLEQKLLRDIDILLKQKLAG